MRVGCMVRVIDRVRLLIVADKHWSMDVKIIVSETSEDCHMDEDRGSITCHFCCLSHIGHRIFEILHIAALLYVVLQRIAPFSQILHNFGTLLFSVELLIAVVYGI